MSALFTELLTILAEFTELFGISAAAVAAPPPATAITSAAVLATLA